MPRPDDRKPGQLRPLSFKRKYTRNAPGSVLVKMGRTTVLCTCCVEPKVPEWMAGRGKGWMTAEYGMLPGSTSSRKPRDKGGKVDGRSVEIQRLIGRSLRAVVDLSRLGERTLWIDCDVLEADGGTRTAAITGAFVALHDALGWMRERGMLERLPVRDFVAAVSVGIVGGVPVLDLDYQEDSGCDTDMNVVMTGAGGFVELQGTAEGQPFSRAEAEALLGLAERGIAELIAHQRSALGS